MALNGRRPASPAAVVVRPLQLSASISSSKRRRTRCTKPDGCAVRALDPALKDGACRAPDQLDILKISFWRGRHDRQSTNSLSLPPTGQCDRQTRSTAKRLAEALGVDETQVIHLALHELASKVLPQYEADEGALTKAQLGQIKKSAPKARGGTVRTSIFDTEST